jgi:hypothetical protein
MVIAANAPANVTRRLAKGGWRLANPERVTRDPWTSGRVLRSETRLR